MTTIYVVDSRHPFNHTGNKIATSTAGAWTVIGSDEVGRAVNITGIGWSGAIAGGGGQLRIRDTDGDIFYSATSGSYPNPDMFTNPLPVIAPFSYYDDAGGASIIIYGTYA